MREVLLISSKVLDMDTEYDIQKRVRSLCGMYGVGCSTERQCAVLISKVSVILDGSKDDIDIIKKALKTSFKVKIV